MNVLTMLQTSVRPTLTKRIYCAAVINTQSQNVQTNIDVNDTGGSGEAISISKMKLPDVHFKNVKLVSPQLLDKFLYTSMKLKFVEEQEVSKEPGIELLRNIASNYDYWIVRNHQNIFLYYRLQMMLQRLKFLKSVGMTPRQKLRHIQKNPPLLLLSFTNESFKSSMVYLRGMIPNSEDSFIHVFHPVTRKLEIMKSDVVDRVKMVEDELHIQQPSALQELLNIPCFFMDPIVIKNIQHLFVHKHSMPFYYNIDRQTANIFPPICNLSGLKLQSTKYFSNKVTNSLISELPTYQLHDILDYSYPTTNGRGTPECLSTFLVEAEFEEYKDRTGGQRLKGRRGFNVPPRQY